MKVLSLVALQCLFLYTSAQSTSKSANAHTSYDKSIDARIRRVENGLLFPVIIKGAPPVRLTIKERMRHYNTAGISIAVINDGKLEWAKGYGVTEFEKNEPVTPETLFAAGSISKPVSAMAALHMVEEGKLNLDDDVNKLLLSWKIPESEFTKESKVTLRKILNHTSGLPLGAGDGKTHRFGDPFPTIVQALKDPSVKVEFIPNCKWSYSSAGYAVAQLLMMDVSKNTFPSLMKEIVFDRLGMKKSTFENPLPPSLWITAATGHNSISGLPIENKYPSTAAMAAGGLWTTPTELAKYVMELQKAKAGRSSSVLTQNSANLMLTPFRAGWGLGLEINTTGRTPIFSHSGGMPGFTSLMVAYNWEGKGAIVMVNQDTYNGFQIVNEIMLGIAREYNWKDYQPIERSVVKVDPKVFKSYDGYYEIDKGYPITIVSRNKRLYLIWALGNVYEMYPVGEGKFVIARDGAPTYEFTKNVDGEVMAIKREWYGGVSEGTKTAIPGASQSGTTTLQLKGYSDALIVSVAGTFNNWNARETLCKRTGDTWTCKLNLEPGEYLYKFVVDNRFISDPSNSETKIATEGGKNSVLIVK